MIAGGLLGGVWQGSRTVLPTLAVMPEGRLGKVDVMVAVISGEVSKREQKTITILQKASN